MLKYLQNEQFLFLSLALWTGVGIVSPIAAMIFIPAYLLLLRRKGDELLWLLGVWFVFTLSDSRQGMFYFAEAVKPALLLMVVLLVYVRLQRWTSSEFSKGFAPFFAVTIVSLLQSPIPFTSFQKMASYFFLVYTIPLLVIRLLRWDKMRFLRGLIALCAIVLGGGLVLRLIIPDFVMFKGERFNGLLGNPNGLGIYVLCFLMMYMLVRHHNRSCFSRKEHYFVLGVIVLSLVLSGSRGGLISSMLFYVGYLLFQRSIIVGFAVLTCLFLFFQGLLVYATTIIVSMGLADYFRLDTLEAGSGRLVAFQFAWQHIQYNLWLGKGFGYADYLMSEWADYFLSLGHQGNVHNSYLTVWLDTGFIGLTAFVWGWIGAIWTAAKKSPLAWAVLFGIMLSTSVESWLAASMNPFTIQLVIILTLLSRREFYSAKSLVVRRRRGWSLKKFRISRVGWRGVS
jgi:O-antigen ligase